MANYPASLDTGVSLPNPSTSSNTNNPSHAGLHASENAAIIAAETKLGTGASTPASNTLLIGTGGGTSAWSALTSAQLAAILSDETGSGSAVFATTPTLITPKVDTINENTPGNGVTVGGVNLKSGFMSGANLTAGTVGSSQVATGAVVQVVATTFTAVATGTTVLPVDDTIPQNTEGDQYMTQSITPRSTTNILVIQVIAWLTHSLGTKNIVAALFQDSTASALAVGWNLNAVASGPLQVSVLHTMVAGTTSATTFKVRGGSDSAGTITFNGSGGLRFFGGISKSAISIIEYKA